jgi:hypothetical protein
MAIAKIYLKWWARQEFLGAAIDHLPVAYEQQKVGLGQKAEGL